MNQEDTDRTRFLTQMLADQEQSALAPLEHYVQRYPGIAEFVRSEYSNLATTRPSSSDRYRREHLLAAGGMGEVHVATDTLLGRPVVVKSIRPGLVSERAHERLQREARVLSRLDHPHVCRILDLVVDADGVTRLVLPLFVGRTLAESLDRARTLVPRPVCVPLGDRAASLPTLLEWLAQVALAVDAAHEVGVVHRDIKPSNLFVQQDGAPVVLDFGLAHDTSTDDQALTRTGEQLGTPLYMAPEQVDGRPCDRRTDVYALGVVLYEALTLQRPFEGSSRQATFQQIMEREPVPVRQHNRTVPRDLEAVCMKAMARKPELRYATAREFAADLRRVLAFEATVARPESGVGKALRVARRRWAALMIGALAMTTATLLAWPVVAEAARRAERLSNFHLLRDELDRPEAQGSQLRDRALSHLEQVPFDELGDLERIHWCSWIYQNGARPRIAIDILGGCIERLEAREEKHWSESTRQLLLAAQVITEPTRPGAGTYDDVLGWAYGRRGWIRLRVGELEGAIKDLDSAEQLFERSGNHHRITNAQHMRGEALAIQGKAQEAEAAFEEATTGYCKPLFEVGDTLSYEWNGPFAIEVVRGHVHMQHGFFHHAAVSYDQFLQNWSMSKTSRTTPVRFRTGGWPMSYIAWIDGGSNHDPAHAILWLAEAILWRDYQPFAANRAARRALLYFDVNYGADESDDLVYHRRYLDLVERWIALGDSPQSQEEATLTLEGARELSSGWQRVTGTAFSQFFDAAWLEAQVFARRSEKFIVISVVRDGDQFLVTTRRAGQVMRHHLGLKPRTAEILPPDADPAMTRVVVDMDLPTSTLKELRELGVVRGSIADCLQ